MKTGDLLLIGAAAIGGYYLAPKEIKDKVSEAVGTVGGTNIIERTIETIKEGGQTIIERVNPTNPDTAGKSSVDQFLEWLAADKAWKPVGDTRVVVPSTDIQGGNFNWKWPTYNIGGGGFTYDKPVINLPEQPSWWEILIGGAVPAFNFVNLLSKNFDIRYPAKGLPATASGIRTLQAGIQADRDLTIKTPSNIERPAARSYSYENGGGSWYKNDPGYTNRNTNTPLPVPYQRELGGGGGWTPE
jgi:hypothetical protein